MVDTPGLFFINDHRGGDDFVEFLKAQVARCDVPLAISGPRWLIIADESGRRRLGNPEDGVRVETARTLKRGKRVIRVLAGGAEIPRAPARIGPGRTTSPAISVRTRLRNRPRCYATRVAPAFKRHRKRSEAIQVRTQGRCMASGVHRSHDGRMFCRVRCKARSRGTDSGSGGARRERFRISAASLVSERHPWPDTAKAPAAGLTSRQGAHGASSASLTVTAP